MGCTILLYLLFFVDVNSFSCVIGVKSESKILDLIDWVNVQFKGQIYNPLIDYSQITQKAVRRTAKLKPIIIIFNFKPNAILDLSSNSKIELSKVFNFKIHFLMIYFDGWPILITDHFVWLIFIETDINEST